MKANSIRIWECIFVLAAVSYALRVLPLTLIRKPIQNRFVRSFLYYIPYATLSVTRRNCRTHSCRTDCVVFLEPFSVGSRRFHRCPDRADAGVRLFGISNGLSTGRLLCNQSSRIANQHEMKCFVHNILLTIF